MRRGCAPRIAERQPNAGFVLIEMLVAMAIGAFLLVALASVTTFLLRAQDRIAARAQESEDAGRALTALSRDIRLAAHVRWAGKHGGFVFSGTPDRLTLALAPPSARLTDGMTAVALQVRGVNGLTEILRAESPLPPDAASAEVLGWGQRASLYAGSSDVAFAYFMRLDTGGEALLDDWPPGDEMPAAVRVTFSPQDASAGERARTLSLRIPLLMDAELACTPADASRCGKDDEAAETEGGEDAVPAAAVDADDVLGWGRYAR